MSGHKWITLFKLGIGMVVMLGALKMCRESLPNRPIIDKLMSGDNGQLSPSLIVRTNTVTEVKPDGTTKTRYLPPEGYVKVVVVDNGRVEASVKNKGTTLSVGPCAFVSDTINVGADCRLLYWNRFGAGVGAGYSFSAKKILPYVAVTWDIPKLRSTSLLTGVGINGKMVAGLRMRF